MKVFASITIPWGKKAKRRKIEQEITELECRMDRALLDYYSLPPYRQSGASGKALLRLNVELRNEWGRLTADLQREIMKG